MINFTEQELDLVRQWFNAVQDLNEKYLEPRDYALAARVYEALGTRVPDSISSKLSSISATTTPQAK